ncbi:Phytochrome two-component sensor histidine kinase Cyanobacterial phytochrome B [Paramagnetospirillum magnetotacticum MS-1]|uniref:histidine kinase n=1 Tax=Paramagnetospirillum magnetotacticum MS-1 TaxID=272627 RepID=A0A0C2UED2_PARME|nr:ATP-binding protein [Paramagnetospirillum magnetotacticum]KIL99862.1 Phytochrome two-component sensor histidine kinase Cyanobacterial phytochrome B [Paramagnetospirillum magnetotacticum MS-1]
MGAGRVLSRHIPLIGRLDDGNGFGRASAVVGAMVVVLFWLSLGFDSGVGRPFEIPAGPQAADGGRIGGSIIAALVLLGGGGLFLMLMQAVLWQRRTAQRLRLRESELAEQRDRLRRYVADLERIADVAAHDLQEPLRRMVSYSQLLASHDKTGCDDDVRDYVGHVVDGARRMRALVSGLQEFVAVDSLPRTGEVSSAWVAMAVARQRLDDVLAEAGATLVVDPLPEVEADPASLVEIFVQLLDNAVRYRSSERRPVIHVSVVRDGDMAKILVCDNGVGIDPARVVRMFEIFYRPHGGDGRLAPGIGTGLAVVRRLVERLGGAVWVESEDGIGSSFGFSLRLGSAPSPREDENRAA